MNNIHPQSIRNIELAAQFQVRPLPDGHYYIAACRLTDRVLTHAFKSQAKHTGTTQWNDEDLWIPIAYETGELITFAEQRAAANWIRNKAARLDNPAPIAPKH